MLTNPRRGTAPADAPSDGDPVAALFRQWREPMARLAYVLTSDAARSDEIVQDAFLQVHANWSRIDNPVGYLRTTVVNGCRSHHRRAALERRHPSERRPDVELEADELGDALASLELRYRAVLALKYLCDLPDADIAAALGIRPATVRTRVKRALAKLRKELSSD